MKIIRLLEFHKIKVFSLLIFGNMLNKQTRVMRVPYEAGELHLLPLLFIRIFLMIRKREDKVNPNLFQNLVELKYHL